MNYYGSSRKLLGNARAAVIAAFEVYNKPTFSYRDECFVILLINAWELLLKAMLSKNKQPIYYPKRRNEPYRTLSLEDAFDKAAPLFPQGLSVLPIHRNLQLLITYRDNAIHFYNAKGFGVLVHALAQTSIINFRDILDQFFDIRLRDEVSWRLLPLGIEPPIDPLAYIASTRDQTKKPKTPIQQYLAKLAQAVEEVEASGTDTDRLLTVFAVKLESIKKIEQADIVVGVDSPGGEGKPITVVRRQDPNITHPIRQKDVVSSIGYLHGRQFTSYVFQAIVWKYQLKSNSRYCWEAKEGVLIKYSDDVCTWMKNLKPDDVEVAMKDYKAYQHSRRKRSAEARMAR